MPDEMSPRARRLREAGYKLTNARLTVLDVLEQRHGHMTSAEVLEAVNAVAPEVGRASVFRALDLFTQLAIIRPTYIDSSITPTYVMLPGGHHHHVICTQCHRVIEFDDCHLEALEAELESRLGVRLTVQQREYYGLCHD